jgi:predicted PurR-regulated permease PerM
MLDRQLDARDRRLLRIVLTLGSITLFFVVVGYLVDVFFYFGDVLLTFFLAWLIAFIVSPLVSRLVDSIPRMPRAGATILVYTAVVVFALGLIIGGAAALAGSITQFIASIPDIRADLPTIVAPFEEILASLGLGQVDLVAQANELLGNLDVFAAQLVQPLQQLAVASIGVIGTLLITFFLSIWMVVDRERIVAFLFRLVPPAYAEEARLLQTSISRSFGGFLRGQAIMGVVYFLVALATHLLLGIPLTSLSAVTAGILMAIPFFGPFVAWAPPVVVALLFQPGTVIPGFAIMIVGWFVVMNILQPRIMQGAVGIHPIVVLASVLIGSKVAGVAGAIFGIPVAAVVASFFFHYLNLNSSERSVASRAAKRLEKRAGRKVHVPREPAPGSAEDIDEVGGASPSAAGGTAHSSP